MIATTMKASLPFSRRAKVSCQSSALTCRRPLLGSLPWPTAPPPPSPLPYLTLASVVSQSWVPLGSRRIWQSERYSPADSEYVGLPGDSIPRGRRQILHIPPPSPCASSPPPPHLHDLLVSPKWWPLPLPQETWARMHHKVVRHYFQSCQWLRK